MTTIKQGADAKPAIAAFIEMQRERIRTAEAAIAFAQAHDLISTGWEGQGLDAFLEPISECVVRYVRGKLKRDVPVKVGELASYTVGKDARDLNWSYDPAWATTVQAIYRILQAPGLQTIGDVLVVWSGRSGYKQATSYSLAPEAV